MSQLKVNTIRHTGASSDAITLASDGTATAKITNNLSNRNLIINGAFQIAQRATSSTDGNYKTVDRWKHNHGGTDENPTYAQVDITSNDPGPWEKGFRKGFRITNGNQTSGAGADDYVQVAQHFEAQDIANSGWDYTSTSSYITISFWIKSSVAQAFAGHLRTVDGTSKAYSFSTGSLSANTWTKVTKTIPGASGLEFANDNTVGLYFYIFGFMGTNLTSTFTTESWANASSTNYANDMTSTWWTTNDAQLEITGVQLEVGDTATDFEHRSYGDELIKCQRYYRRIKAESTNRYITHGVVDGDGNTVQTFILFETPFRSTIHTFETTGTGGDYQIRRDTNKECGSVPSGDAYTDRSCYIGFTSNSHGWGTGDAAFGMFKSSSAYLGFSAEL